MSESKMTGLLIITKLEHSEIEEINDAAVPVSIIAGLIPEIGPVLAAAIAGYMWFIRRTDRKYGYRGVVIITNPASITPIVRGPDAWDDY